MSATVSALIGADGARSTRLMTVYTPNLAHSCGRFCRAARDFLGPPRSLLSSPPLLSPVGRWAAGGVRGLRGGGGGEEGGIQGPRTPPKEEWKGECWGPGGARRGESGVVGFAFLMILNRILMLFIDI